VIELFVEREAAEQGLRVVLTDEPAWTGALSVVEIPGPRHEPN
jgi:hypothetical protein